MDFGTFFISLLFLLISITKGSCTPKNSPRERTVFLNGLFDAIPGVVRQQMEQIIATEKYALINVNNEAFRSSEQSDIDFIGKENEANFRKNTAPAIQNCERHPQANQGPYCNTCLDPILQVRRHESQSINADANAHSGSNRIERVLAVICPWHIRSDNDRMPSTSSDVSTVRSRGRTDTRGSSTDDAAISSLRYFEVSPILIGMLFSQTVIPDLQAHFRRSELHIKDFLERQCRCPGGGNRMVVYDIMLGYEDSGGSTRPSILHYVASLYKWMPNKSMILMEISTEVQDNSPYFNHAEPHHTDWENIIRTKKVVSCKVPHSLRVGYTLDRLLTLVTK